MSKESKLVFICPCCGNPARNPKCEDLGRIYNKVFGGEVEDGDSDRS